MSGLPSDEKLFVLRNRIHHPNYEFWWNWLQSKELSEQESELLWTELLEKWVMLLSKDLGDKYTIASSNGFLMLSPLKDHQVQSLLSVAIQAKRIITSEVITEFADGSPILVIIFQDESLYRKYIEPLYTENGSSWMPSTGVYLSEVTYPHIALMAFDDLYGSQVILSHELTHFYTSAYKLPRWLDEGVACVVQQSTIPRAVPSFSMDVYRDFQNFWTPENIEDFLSGKLFEALNTNHEFVYLLAEILVRNLINIDRDDFHKFIVNSEREDGGRGAARRFLNIEIDELISSVLEIKSPF